MRFRSHPYDICIKIGKRTKEIFLKFLLFYLANKEIHCEKIQNNIYILNFAALFSVGFPHLQDNKREFQKELSFCINVRRTINI